MSQPPDFSEKGKENLVCKLNKALYGFHQSGREWLFEINKVLFKMGFSKLLWSNCVSSYDNDSISLLYMDDFVLFLKTEK